MKVIVLGGGVAGMSAAHELAERDFEVVVYETRPIPGGKARSMPVPGSGMRGRIVPRARREPSRSNAPEAKAERPSSLGNARERGPRSPAAPG